MEKVANLRGFKKIDGHLKYDYYVNRKGKVINGKTKHVLKINNHGYVSLKNDKNNITNLSVMKLVKKYFKNPIINLDNFTNYDVYANGKVINNQTNKKLKAFYTNQIMRKLNHKSYLLKDDNGNYHKISLNNIRQLYQKEIA